jgi:DNA repair photolyase
MPVIYEPNGAALEYSPLALNLYHGCKFACLYCYAPAIAREPRADWSLNPHPKANILQRIEADAKKLAGDPRQILLCFTSDPYQTIEAAELTRSALLILEHYNLTATVLTKGGNRAESDFDILKRNNWTFGTSISWSDDKHRIQWEPYAAPVTSRVEAIVEARRQGIKTWVSLEPVIDPDQALKVINRLSAWVDFWKIGKLNHQTVAVDWWLFYDRATTLLQQLGADYYIKKDLAAAAEKSRIQRG